MEQKVYPSLQSFENDFNNKYSNTFGPLFSGSGIKAKKSNSIMYYTHKATDGVAFYNDCLKTKERITLSVQGRIGNQSRNKGINKKLLNPQVSKRHIVYRKTKQNTYILYGEYRILNTEEKIHPDINGDLRTIINMHLEKL